MSADAHTLCPKCRTVPDGDDDIEEAGSLEMRNDHWYNEGVLHITVELDCTVCGYCHKILSMVTGKES